MANFRYREEYYGVTETIITPQAKDQRFNVSAYGAGGSGSAFKVTTDILGAGGGSGYKATGSFTIPQNTPIDIQIGEGGKGVEGVNALDFADHAIGKTGGTTFFGSYLCAPGGHGGRYESGGLGGKTGGNAIDGYKGEVNGVSYQSGYGADALDGIGRGGAVNYGYGDGSKSSGSAGVMVTKVDNSGVHKRIANGGNGFVISRFYQEIL